MSTLIILLRSPHYLFLEPMILAFIYSCIRCHANRIYVLEGRDFSVFLTVVFPAIYNKVPDRGD